LRNWARAIGAPHTSAQGDLKFGGDRQIGGGGGSLAGFVADCAGYRADARSPWERRHVTVMFCDLVDSTGIAARLDAEEWRDLVGAYLDGALPTHSRR
jgi:hypothetical protein